MSGMTYKKSMKIQAWEMCFFQDGVQDGRRYIKMVITNSFVIVELKFWCYTIVKMVSESNKTNFVMTIIYPIKLQSKMAPITGEWLEVIICTLFS